MSAQSPIMADKQDYVAWLAAKETPKSAWRIGTEHEKFLFHKGSFAPVAYEGEQGIGALLQKLQDEHGFTPILEHDQIIGLKIIRVGL